MCGSAAPGRRKFSQEIFSDKKNKQVRGATWIRTIDTKYKQSTKFYARKFHDLANKILVYLLINMKIILSFKHTEFKMKWYVFPLILTLIFGQPGPLVPLVPFSSFSSLFLIMFYHRCNGWIFLRGPMTCLITHNMVGDENKLASCFS